MTPPKVVLLGLDGLSWGVLQPLIDAGRLPTFARLIETGASGVLASEYPILSPPIWTTIATSRKRAEHGIVDFYCKDERGAERLVDSTERRRSAIWNWLGAFGKTVGFIGWWASWPAESVNGWMVTDRMARSHWSVYPGGTAKLRLAYPPELETELGRFLVDLPIAADLEGRVVEEIIAPAFVAAHPKKSIDSFEPVYERRQRPNAPPPGDAEMRDLLRSLVYVE